MAVVIHVLRFDRIEFEDYLPLQKLKTLPNETLSTNYPKMDIAASLIKQLNTTVIKIDAPFASHCTTFCVQRSSSVKFLPSKNYVR